MAMFSRFKVCTRTGESYGNFQNIVFAQLFLNALLERGFDEVYIKSARDDDNNARFDKLRKELGYDSVQGELNV